MHVPHARSQLRQLAELRRRERRTRRVCHVAVPHLRLARWPRAWRHVRGGARPRERAAQGAGGSYVWLQDVLESFLEFPSPPLLRGVFVLSAFHARVVPQSLRALVTPNALDPRYFVDGPNERTRLVCVRAGVNGHMRLAYA